MAGDQRAGRGHAHEHRLVPVADRRRGLLAQRGVRLVADDDRVGVRDVAGVAHEPLVGLDRHRPVGAILAAHERRRDALAVAAVAQLAEELVDEVAPVGEDQRAAGARALDEAERGDRLAGARRVLEPEALGGVGVLRRLGAASSSAAPPASSSQSCGSSGSSSSSSSSSPGIPAEASAAGGARGRDAVGRASRCPTRRAARSACPRARRPGARRARCRRRAWGSSSQSSRSSPSSSDQRWRQATDGTFAPASSSASAASSARRRAVPGASWAAASSPSSTNGSRVNAAARLIASAEGVACVASRATVVGSAIRLGEMTG